MLLRSLFFLQITLALVANVCYGQEEIVIAGQGDVSPLTGNTLSSFVLAAATGADYIEQQVVMTKDDKLITFDDIYLDTMTNVVKVFPERKRDDGRYYVIDFTLAEIQRLNLLHPGLDTPVRMQIPTLDDTLNLDTILEEKLGNIIGIYLEIKKPWFHLNEGKDISNTTLIALKRFGYSTIEQNIYLACYDPEELQRIHKHLMPEHLIDLKLVQKIDTSDDSETKRLENAKWATYDYDWMYTQFGLKVIKNYADAVSFTDTHILSNNGLALSEFITAIMAMKIELHAVIHDETSTPQTENSFDTLLEQLYFDIGVKAVTTSNWVLTQNYLRQRAVNVAKVPEALKTEKMGITPENSVDLTLRKNEDVREATNKL